jgi:hypothetical protein
MRARVGVGTTLGCCCTPPEAAAEGTSCYLYGSLVVVIVVANHVFHDDGHPAAAAREPNGLCFLFSLQQRSQTTGTRVLMSKRTPAVIIASQGLFVTVCVYEEWNSEKLLVAR